MEVSRDDGSRRALARVRSMLAVSLAIGSLSAHVASAQDAVDLPNPLGVDDVIAVARERRPDVAAADSAADAAEQRPRIVRAPPDPVVFASIDHLPTMWNGVDFSGGVEVSAPLGRVLHNRRLAAEAAAVGQRTDVERVALDVELDAAMAFWQLHLARSLGDVLARQVEVANELVAGAMSRYEAGVGLQSDVLRAEAEKARIGASLSAVAGMREGAEGMLDAAMGRVAGSPIPELDTSALDAELPSLDESLEAALEARPELAAQRSFIASARADVDVMRGMYRPMMMVRAGGARTMTEGTGLMAMLGFSVPIWRGRLRAGVSEARAMQAMNESELLAVQRMIEGQVAQAHGQVVATSARFHALRDDVVPRARQAVTATLAQYAAGRVPLVATVEAARTLFSLEIEALGAEVDLGMALARLHRAVGRSGATR